MYFFIIFILLALSVVTLFLSKSYPLFKPVGGVLPILAILVLIFKPGSPDALPVSKQLLNEEARAVGEQLARSIISTLPKKGVILVIHPDENSRNRIQKKLQGMGNALEFSGYTLITHSLIEADAVDDPLTDGTTIGSPTVRKLAANQNNPVGVVLLGLFFIMGDEQSAAPLPQLVLATVGDPSTSEWALDRGLAVAALFEKSQALSSINDKTLTTEDRFNLRFEIRTSNR